MFAAMVQNMRLHMDFRFHMPKAPLFHGSKLCYNSNQEVAQAHIHNTSQYLMHTQVAETRNVSSIVQRFQHVPPMTRNLSGHWPGPDFPKTTWRTWWSAAQTAQLDLHVETHFFSLEINSSSMASMDRLASFFHPSLENLQSVLHSPRRHATGNSSTLQNLHHVNMS